MAPLLDRNLCRLLSGQLPIHALGHPPRVLFDGHKAAEKLALGHNKQTTDYAARKTSIQPTPEMNLPRE